MLPWQSQHTWAKAKGLALNKERKEIPKVRTSASSCVHVYTCKSATKQSSLSSQVCKDSVPSSHLGAAFRGSTASDLNSLSVLEEADLNSSMSRPAHHTVGKDKHLHLCPLRVFQMRLYNQALGRHRTCLVYPRGSPFLSVIPPSLPRAGCV